ncbi:hypothetical protein Tco_0352312 [Tanacetum coccineum]
MEVVAPIVDDNNTSSGILLFNKWSYDDIQGPLHCGVSSYEIDENVIAQPWFTTYVNTSVAARLRVHTSKGLATPPEEGTSTLWVDETETSVRCKHGKHRCTCRIVRVLHRVAEPEFQLLELGK